MGLPETVRAPPAGFPAQEFGGALPGHGPAPAAVHLQAAGIGCFPAASSCPGDGPASRGQLAAGGKAPAKPPSGICWQAPAVWPADPDSGVFIPFQPTMKWRKPLRSCQGNSPANQRFRRLRSVQAGLRAVLAAVSINMHIHPETNGQHLDGLHTARVMML